MLFYKYLKISLINFLNLPKKDAKRLFRLGSIIIKIGVLLFSACSRESHLEVYDLKCENLRNPLGIDKTEPRFSWKIKSSLNGTEQYAFQILAATDSTLLSEKRADLWNSGKVESCNSILVQYKGNQLNSGMAVYWKVRIYDKEENVSPWSPVARFSIGLLEERDWHGSYIGYNTDAGDTECPQLYKSFDIKEPGSQIFLHVNSLGYHEVYLNGRKVGNGILTPAVSQYGKRSLSNTYDLSSFVKEGRNDLMLWLGSGWYTSGLFDIVDAAPLVRAQLEELSGNMREIILVTDDSWQGRNSSYKRIGNWQPGRFGGEILNGSMAENDLLTENIPGREWEPVSIVNVPDHEVSPQMTELNLITDTVNPVAIVQLKEGTFLVDMGTNLTGWLEVHFESMPESQDISIEYADYIDENANFKTHNQQDRYIAKGKGSEVFINKFNYHGFRYLRLTNLPEMPDIDSISGYLVRTGYEMASEFECSDYDLNRIHDLLHYTLRCLSIGGDLVDCPHLERLGYGGDGNASTVTAQTMFNLAPLYNNWLLAWSDVIRDDGGMPHTAPNPYPAGGGPYWCGFIISASWKSYLNYGDTLLLKKYYPVMKKWLGYVDKYTVDGLLQRWPDTDYRSWYLGDWATPEGIDQTAEASVDLVNNSFIVRCYDNMQKIARVIGENDDINYFLSKREKLKKKVHETFFNESDNTYGTGTQIDLAFPLLTGIVPDSLKDEVTESLYHETEVDCDGHIGCGLVGIPVLTEWAVENEAADLIYSILQKRTYPGYLYMIENEATTTWEHWDGARSRIHNCYNGIGSWFYQAIGGIRILEGAPAYRKVLIDPQIPDDVDWAKTYKETPFGKLSVNWELKKDSMDMELQIPVGTTSFVVLPEKVNKYILNDLEHQLPDDSPPEVEIKSGKYQIKYKMPAD